MIEPYYEKIKTTSALLTALVVGIEVSKEIRKTRFRNIFTDWHSLLIIFMITGIMYLWIDYGDDLLAYFIDKNNSIFFIASTLIGMSLFKIPEFVSMIK